MSSLKVMAVRRCSARPGVPPGAAAQVPLAEKLASGMVKLNLLSSHSRPAPPRLTASISARPRRLPSSSKSSMTMSSAGSVPGCSSSRVSTCLASVGAILSRASRA